MEELLEVNTTVSSTRDNTVDSIADSTVITENEVIVPEILSTEDETDTETGTDTDTSEEAAVTRVEWLKELTTVFGMTVEEDNYPDNYYSDIDSDSEYYHDVMLATEFGLIDIVPGEALCPEAPATREFAAHTLNFCLGYSWNEEEAYTFAEADSVTYPNDIQIAIKHGWFELVDGSFLPEEAITLAEKEFMLADAQAEVDSMVLDPDHENTFEFADGVIVLPEGTQSKLTDINELTVYSIALELEEGDIFAAIMDDFPVVRKVVSLEEKENQTIIQVESVAFEEAYKNVDMQGNLEIDWSGTKVYNDAVTLNYIVGGTEEENWEDGTVYASVEEVGEQEISAIEVVQSYEIPDALREEYDLAEGITADITAKIVPVGEPQYDIKWDGFLDPDIAYFQVNFDVSFSCNVETDLLEAMGKMPSVELVKIPIAGIGYVELSLEMSLKGSITLDFVENVTLGAIYTDEKGIRPVADFRKKTFTIQAQVEASVGVKLEAGIDVLSAFQGDIYGGVGATARVNMAVFADDKKPYSCADVQAWLYTHIGFDLKFLKWEYNKDFVIFNESNSPVKVGFHFEDDKQVYKCARESSGSGSGSSGSGSGSDSTGSGSGSGSTGSGSGGSSNKRWNYYTPITSKYGYSGASTGLDENGNEYTLFSYTLDSNNNATITKYRGNVSAISIPSKLDGYTVIAIGKNAFYDNDMLRNVYIPDTITSIADYAFYGCDLLEKVTLSNTLKTMGGMVFYNCVSLTSITIPKSLEYVGANVFTGCNNLSDVTLEEGTTKICDYLFYDCDSFKTIEIPDTVTEIGYSAFYDCDGLVEIVIPDSVLEIDSSAFYSCTALKDVELGNAVDTIGAYAFQYCAALTAITIPDSVLEIGYSAFYGCINLEEATIGNSVKHLPECVFQGCTSLSDLALGESLQSIGRNAFYENTSLETVVIPDSVTAIYSSAFGQCSKLSDVTLSKKLKSIAGYAFVNCDSLTAIEIPASLESITSYITGNAYYYTHGPFEECDNLKEVTFEENSTKVCAYLFYYCPGIEEIVIPDTVTEIEGDAFYSCDNLKKVTISDSVLKIQSTAFYSCKKLEEVTIGGNVDTIDSSAFANCTALKGITIPASVTVIGSNAFYGCSNLQEAIIGDGVKRIEYYAFYNCAKLSNLVLGEAVETIGSYAFYNNTSLQKLVIPDSVTTIEEYAFSGCDSLEDVTLSKKLKTIYFCAFQDCDSLQSIEIPASLESVGYYIAGDNGVSYNNRSPFMECDNLKTVTFGDRTTTVCSGLFYKCPGIETITIPGTVTEIESDAFAYCPNLKTVILSDSLLKISERAFIQCTKLNEVDFGNSLVNIGSEAFSQCTALMEVALPDSVAEIGSSAFYGCSKMEEVTLGDSLKTIGASAFQNCPKLTTVDLGDSVQRIEHYAFYGDTALTGITLPDTVTYLGYYAFYGCSSLAEATLSKNLTTIEQHTFYGCEDLVAIELPEGLTTIDQYAFYDCNSLQSVTIPDTVTSIGKYSFADCDSMSSLTLGSSLTSIPAYAFDSCISLSEVKLPYRMKTVADYAFTKCSSLTKVVVPRNATSIGSSAFDYLNTLNIYGVSGTYAEEYANTVGAIFVSHEIPATAVELNEKELTINYGDTANLILTVTPADFTDAITWKSSDTNIITVDDTGKVTTNALGSATIKITVGNVTTSCKVNVVQPVTSIRLNTSSLTLKAQETYTLTATVYPTSASNQKLTWTSSDESVAIVDEQGKITALTKGGTTITATAQDGSGIYAICQVTVTNSTVICETPSQMESTHNYGDNCSDSWIYTVEDAEALKVTFDEQTEMEEDFDYLYIFDAEDNQVGKYTGTELAGQTIKVPGNTVKIVMESDGSGNTWGFKVTDIVTAPLVEIIEVTEVKLDQSTLTLTEEETATLVATVLPEDATDKTVTWSSSDETVATVKDGLVTAVKAGTATITAATANGKTATCEVTINAKIIDATEVKLNHSSLSLTEGETGALEVTVLPEDTTDKTVTWSSSDETVATVKDGLVTAVKAGTATITAATANGKTVTCEVTVNAKIIDATEVKLNQSTLSLTEGETGTLEVTVLPEDTTDKTVTWSSSDEMVATVKDGVVTAVKAGTATITVNTVNGKTATCEVTVTEKEAPDDPDDKEDPDDTKDPDDKKDPDDTKDPVTVTEVILNKTTVELKEGYTITLTATVLPENAEDKTIIWSSNDTEVATVENGLVTAVKAGSATITAITSNGKAATCTVIVTEIIPIGDVSVEWQKAPTQYVYNKGIMTGKGTLENGEVKFDPEAPLTRPEFAQILFAAEDKPAISTDKDFADLVEGEWYVNAVRWAAEKEIVSGYTDGRFGVSDNITREQLALMLYKYAKLKGYDTTESTELDKFTDADTASEWAEPALKWAVANGVLSGAGDKLNPGNTATRAECAAMLRTFMEKFEK